MAVRPQPGAPGIVVACVLSAAVGCAETRARGKEPLARGLCDQVVRLQSVILSSPPEVLLVVDRSASMGEPLPGGRTSKWEVMRTALANLLADLSTEVHFGLDLFPQDESCGAGEVVVDPGDDAGEDIESELDDSQPGGETPTHQTLVAARAHFRGRPAPRGGRFIVLATDGEPVCSSDLDTVQAIQELGADGIRTFVLGYGQKAPSEETLMRWARAGATERSYSADSSEELEAALGQIGRAVLTPSCSYPLDIGRSRGVRLRVRIGGADVNPGGDGWAFDAESGTLTFLGASCAALRRGTTPSIEVDVECPSAPAE